MNYRFIIILWLIVSPARMLRAQEIVPTDCPNQTQLEMQKRGYGMFIHFGVNTFDEKEWSDGTIPVDKYRPDLLDCDQ